MPHCYDIERRKDDGSCCPRGMVFDREFGRCRVPPQVCSDPERRRDDGTCCPYGTVVSDNSGRCVQIEIACPLDTRWNFITRDCLPIRPICGPGERYNWRTRDCERIHVYCPWGTRYNRETRRCEKVDLSCPDGTHWSRREHRCVKGDDAGQCPDGSPRIAGRRLPLPAEQALEPQDAELRAPGLVGSERSGPERTTLPGRYASRPRQVREER